MRLEFTRIGFLFNYISNMATVLEGLEEGRKAKIHPDSLRATLKKKWQIGKRLAMMEYVNSGLKIHFHP